MFSIGIIWLTNNFLAKTTYTSRVQMLPINRICMRQQWLDDLSDSALDRNHMTLTDNFQDKTTSSLKSPDCANKPYINETTVSRRFLRLCLHTSIAWNPFMNTLYTTFEDSFANQVSQVLPCFLAIAKQRCVISPYHTLYYRISSISLIYLFIYFFISSSYFV